MTTMRQYIQKHRLTPAIIDRFLDPSGYNWARFDPVLGYTHSHYSVRDGVDGCHTTNRMAENGARHSPSASGQPSRINTYGDSFTHCDQVSDGETWQEYLAAHLGEPIRNFGTGGHGVYQAWRRMQREEGSANAAEHLIVNLFEDDHRRNVMSWRWLDLSESFYERCRMDAESGTAEAAYFHNSPWDHLVWDLEHRTFVERRSLCPRPADLYKLCDPEWLEQNFRKDWFAHVAMAKKGIAGVDVALLREYADAFNVPFAGGDADALAESASRLHTVVGLHASIWVIERMTAFAAKQRKQLLFVLSYGSRGMVNSLQGKPADDALLVKHLRDLPYPVIDMRDHHASDYRDFSCDHEAYAKRYWIGHYNPRGNHFFAYAIKDAVVGWLDPKPVAYRDCGRDPMARVARMTGGATVGG
jgi:hypothetical protein